MTISGYLSEHWGLIILLTGIFIVLHSDVHLEHRIINKIAFTNTLLFLYSISCYAETYLGEQQDYSRFRPLLCAVNYSLIIFILLSAIMIMYPTQKRYLFFPAVLNAVLSFVSIPTGIVFRISSDNHFIRGTLGYLSYFIAALYMFYLIYSLFRNIKAEKEDYNLMIFLSITSVLCLVMPLFMYNTSHWFNNTIAIDVLIYYVFLLQQFTKRDSLTKLLNRQSYYSDTEKYIDDITAVVAMDMDGLKEVNDNHGHIAGDTALKTLADCFYKAARQEQRVYRIGGDEYVILCRGTTEEKVKELIARMKENVAQTEFSCSIGYAMKNEGNTIDELYHQADKMLYVEKEQYYIRSGKKR